MFSPSLANLRNPSWSYQMRHYHRNTVAKLPVEMYATCEVDLFIERLEEKAEARRKRQAEARAKKSTLGIRRFSWEG